jgi:hypothetical protein
VEIKGVEIAISMKTEVAVLPSCKNINNESLSTGIQSPEDAPSREDPDAAVSQWFGGGSNWRDAGLYGASDDDEHAGGWDRAVRQDVPLGKEHGRSSHQNLVENGLQISYGKVMHFLDGYDLFKWLISNGKSKRNANQSGKTQDTDRKFDVLPTEGHALAEISLWRE